jgi:ATP-dependent helicase Lhr and Lhr-like helicase
VVIRQDRRMPLSEFHPAVRAWFETNLGDPTQPQRQGWPAIRSGRHVLIAAPTGTGKTLSAFLCAIDALVKQGPYLTDGTQVLYVSPLKALGNDIQKNLEIPLAGIAAVDAFVPRIRVTVRTGDTTATERAKMARKPPHILVTTPESLFILLNSEGGRGILRTVRTVIIDEIHALAGNKRGSHLALSLERLEALAGPFQRIGLSATQKPLNAIAEFLAGVDRPCTIVDAGHLRHLDLGIEIPQSPLEAIASHQIWSEHYERMVTLIGEHRTTLVFVNTRKLAERLALRLSERLGQEHVACHHGSLSKERRLDAEQRLKAGKLKVLVATASLELGIDIGDVDLVLQVGSSRTIAAFLQRVGRAGHGIHRTPKGRAFPLTLDELVEVTALIRVVKDKELDRIPQPLQPLDLLAQQVVAACVSEAWDEDALYERLRRAWPYRELTRADFDAVVAMHTRGRRALLHHDGVNRRLRAAKRARLVAVTSGGAIPDNANLQVREEPGDTLVGTLDEDFSLESSPGDTFQLGNTSWRILRVDGREGVVRVANANGAPPTIPFWLGEAPGRSRELSAAVGRVREDCDGPGWGTAYGLDAGGAKQLYDYLSAGRAALGAVPSPTMVIAERFFDDSGGMQLVIHAPFGSRINRAWGLALRKRFCGGFGFELEAAATEEALLLSLAPSTSFPLGEVFSYLSPATVRDLLVQACITGGQFELRWRWNAQRALLVERFAGGKKVPAFLTRIRSNDALVEAFPQVLACPETLPGGPLPIPDHPLVQQTITDCLTELMDIDGLMEVLAGIRSGHIATRAVDTAEPSPFARAILSAAPYAFLDDTPFEERRTRAVAPSPSSDGRIPPPASDLDPEAVAEVRAQAWPQPRNAEDVHEALRWMGWVTDDEAAEWTGWLAELHTAGRVVHDGGRWFATETDRTDGVALWRGRLEALGPVAGDDPALAELETRGEAMRTRLDGRAMWCNRRLLARIHRLMLDRQRRIWRPVSPEQFLRFLTRWQGAHPDTQLDGPRGVMAAIMRLAGFALPGPAWTGKVLPLRVRGFRHEWLDQLCLAGEVAWGRLWSVPASGRPSLSQVPLCLLPRAELDQWLALAPPVETESLSGNARAVLSVLDARGALFQHELVRASGLLPEHVEMAQTELIAHGLITCDSYGAMRWLLLSSERRGRSLPPGGRWSRLRPLSAGPDNRGQALAPDALASEDQATFVARQLLTRTGVVFRLTIERERQPIPWRDLLRALRRMELAGEVRGGRFVASFNGEQFALPEAAEQLRTPPEDDQPIEISGADPLNFHGILIPDERVPAVTHTRVKVV